MMADLTDLGVRCALCNAIVAAFGKSVPGNTTGECSVAIKGNTLTVKTGSGPHIAAVEMKFAHPMDPVDHVRANTFAVTRADRDPNLVQTDGTEPMTIEALARHIFETFVGALRVR